MYIGHTFCYAVKVKTRKADHKKSSKVKSERGFSPEEVVMGGKLLDVRENTNYRSLFV
jgi:hypothetical protein